MGLTIENRAARRLWLQSQGLASAPTGPLDVLAIIRRLGFVQIDTIRNVSRAHHHILWSRNQNYREAMLDRLLARDRAVFEHFTHDASVLPMEFYPMWQRQFRRLGEKVARSPYHRTPLGPSDLNAIRERLRAEGPLCGEAFAARERRARGMWMRPPHKIALDRMWYAGELATSHRENFRKFYDLSERVIPPHIRARRHSDSAQIDWLCRAALDRLGFASLGEIQLFWDAVSTQEVRAWASSAKGLVPVEVRTANRGRMTCLAPADIETRLSEAPRPTARLRILNPFDPAVRDRTRLSALFGFDYRNEIFVPAARRKWGYYVYPLLEGDRFVGRIELKADRRADVLTVVQLWPEPGIRWTVHRAARLAAELTRLARFIGITRVIWGCAMP